ncbi:MAG: hypothetical protein QG665_231 [Patescibacteria group bacterium]|nr:hypothetical protein [Patescibacteria group bacterium]
MLNLEKYKIIIENPKGSYKSFETEGDDVWQSYPLKGVTYPVDYGYIQDYIGEDDAELDIFVGSGNQSGYIKVWRLDVPEETKFFANLTETELNQVIEAFSPVLIEHKILDEENFEQKISEFKK